VAYIAYALVAAWRGRSGEGVDRVWSDAGALRPVPVAAAVMTCVLGYIGSNNRMGAGLSSAWLLLALIAAVVLPPLCGGSPIFALALVTGLAAFGARHQWQGAYRDAQSRASMTAEVASPMVRGILTTPARAKTLDELLVALADRVAPGDALLAYGSIPLLHFMTGTKPVLGNPWPILYSEAELGARLLRLTEMPKAIVRARDDLTRSREWPLATRHLRPPWGKRYRMLDTWSAAHGYHAVWRNDVFEVQLRASP
jgi:hypothetical protein